MSLQICPKCKQKAFTWTMEDESDVITLWGCFECGYSAKEDETLERECPDCGQKTQSLLKDDEKEYWWCSSCNRITYNV